MSGLFGGGGSSTPNTPLTGVTIQSSANGLPIPLLYGTNRLAPNLIWYGDFVAIASQQSSGGKGGSAPSSTTYTYRASFALGLCEGPAVSILNVWLDKTKEVPTSLFSTFSGATPQTAWSYLTTNHPGQDLGYSSTVYAAAANYNLGSSASLPSVNFEVSGRLLFGSGIIDANPSDIINDLFTNGALGIPNAPAIQSLTQYSNYCVSNGLFLSPAYTQQKDAKTIITDLMQLTNSGIYFSDSVVKIVPYGDVATTGNGATYTPAFGTIYNLTDDNFLDDKSSDPVTIQRNAVAATVNGSSDAYNQVQIDYNNRVNDYQTETCTVQDQVSIDTYGLRPMSKITADQIALQSVAQASAQLILQRSVYIRAQYTFRLGWQWCFLEPCDFVTLTDSALGLNLYPVRIIQIEEDEYGTLTVLAEDAPAGVSSHVSAPIPSNSGYSQNYNAAPGSVSTAVIFEPPFSLAVGSGLEVWAGVTGPVGSTLWGGCNVWVSYDGTTYKLLTTVDGPARVGHLTAALTNTSTGPLAVQLDGMGGQLAAASAADAAALNTLFYVGGANPEFMAYQGSTLTSANNYSLSGLIRGAYGSSEAAHSTSDPFVRLDDALAKSGSLDLSLAGSTIHFKFQSFNIWGGGLEDLATLTVYNYVISGLQATGNPVPGLTVAAVPGSAVLTQLSWTAVPGVDHYVIDQSGDGITWQRTGETKATTWADSSLFGSATRFRVASVRAFAGSWSASVFLNVSYIGMWNSNSATPMWNSVATTTMWS